MDSKIGGGNKGGDLLVIWGTEEEVDSTYFRRNKGRMGVAGK